MEHHIYMLKWGDNPERYIGLSSKPKRRQQSHMTGSNHLVDATIERLGNPEIQILEAAPDRITGRLREAYWIDYFDSATPGTGGLNIVSNRSLLAVPAMIEHQRQLDELRQILRARIAPISRL